MTDDRGYPPERKEDEMPSLEDRVSPEPAATRPEWGEQPAPTESPSANPPAAGVESGVELFTRQTGAEQPPGREDEFGVRIDELVSSALEDQAREHREVTETLTASRDALVATHREVARLRELLEGREQSVDQIRDRMRPLEKAILDLANLISEIPGPLRSAIEDSAGVINAETTRSLRDLQMGLDSLSSQQTSAVAALAEELGAAITETARLGVADVSDIVQGTGDRTFERVQSGIDAMKEQLTEVSDALETTSAGLNDSLAEATAELTDALQEQGGEVGEVVGRAVTTLSKRLDELTQRVHQTDLRLTESNTRVEALQESLIAYLSQRDERLERVRDTILENLIEEMASSLKARDRVRLAAALRDAEQRRKDHRDAERYRKLRGTSPGPREDEISTTRMSFQAAGRTAAGGAQVPRPVAEPGVRKQPPPAARPAGAPGATSGRGDVTSQMEDTGERRAAGMPAPDGAPSPPQEVRRSTSQPQKPEAQRAKPATKTKTKAASAKAPASRQKSRSKPKGTAAKPKGRAGGSQSKAKAARSSPQTRTPAPRASRANPAPRRGANPNIQSVREAAQPQPQRAQERPRQAIRIESQE